MNAPSLAASTATLHKTRALCPHCMRVLPARIVADDDNRVWMLRSCPEHGELKTPIWPDADHYRQFVSLAFPKTPPDPEALGGTEALHCPTGCGICRRHQRRPTLVEIEVTQGCNLRCPVCFMSAGQLADDPPLERIADLYEAIATTATVECGVQITGGEPTMREDLPQIVRMGRERGFWGIEVNTNGLVIARDDGYLETLVRAGLTGIYLQFDGVSAEPYQHIRGADLLNIKQRAIERCREAGVQVVLAMTIVRGVNDHEVGAVVDYALANSDVVAGLALQPAFTSGRFEVAEEFLGMGDVIFMLEEQTAGLITAQDIWPLGCSHPLCDAGTFLVPTDEAAAVVSVAPATPAAEAATPTPATAATPAAATPTPAPGAATATPAAGAATPTPATAATPAAGAATPAFIPITRDLTREDYLALYDPVSPQGSVFGDIVAKKGLSAARGLSLIIMNYMDAFTMDLERMEECSMFVTMPDGRLIPFCAYQLTDCDGRRTHLPWGIAPDDAGLLRWEAS